MVVSPVAILDLLPPDVAASLADAARRNGLDPWEALVIALRDYLGLTMSPTTTMPMRVEPESPVALEAPAFIRRRADAALEAMSQSPTIDVVVGIIKDATRPVRPKEIREEFVARTGRVISTSGLSQALQWALYKNRIRHRGAWHYEAIR